MEQFLEQILDTVKRVGPPKLPTMFGQVSGKTHVAVLADDPIVSAKEAIRQLHLTSIVIVATVSGPTGVYVALHAENATTQINKIYSLPDYNDSGATEYSVFDNILL